MNIGTATLASEECNLEAERDKIIEEYMPLVESIAERMHQKSPPNIDVEDLISEGTIGLIRAVDEIDEGDHSKATNLRRYVYTKIGHAILNYIRQEDSLSRGQRRIAGRAEKTSGALMHILQKHPTDEEVCEHIGVGANDYNEYCKATSTHASASRPKKAAETLYYQNDPFEQADFWKMMLKGLEKREQLILLMYYKADLPMNTIGESLHRAESRVSQLHSRIITQLKKRFTSNTNA